jgi:hypothetical protein
MKEGDRYRWLDPYRGGLDEVVCWVISPTCVCDWETRDVRPPGDDLPVREFLLTGRRRHCVLHGEQGMF